MAASIILPRLVQLCLLPSLFDVAFWNSLQYRFVSVHITSFTNVRSTSCKKLVKIGSAVFELKWGRKWNCAATQPKFEDHC